MTSVLSVVNLNEKPQRAQRLPTEERAYQKYPGLLSDCWVTVNLHLRFAWLIFAVRSVGGKLHPMFGESAGKVSVQDSQTPSGSTEIGPRVAAPHHSLGDRAVVGSPGNQRTYDVSRIA